MRYAERRSSMISCVADRRGGRGVVAAGERYGRNFIRHGDSSETPATMSYCGASRCQPIGAPGRYSLMRAIANAFGSTPAQSATLARNGRRKSGSGFEAARSYDYPKNPTPPARHQAPHFEVRELDVGDRVE